MRPLPLLLALAAPLVPSPTAPALHAQTTIARATALFASPGENPVATLHPGTAVRAGAERNGYTEVTIEGHVSASLLGGARQQFPISVRATEVRLRAGPSTSAAIVAEMRQGMGLREIGRRRGWVHVRRTGWVRSSALSRGRPQQTAAASRRTATPAQPQQREGATRRAEASMDGQAPANVTPSPAPRRDTIAEFPSTAGDGVLTPQTQAALRVAPDGDSVGVVAPGARVQALARDRGWVRVRVEGWVRERDLAPADTALRRALSAADLRADPEGTKGAIVQWDVEVLAFQRADLLRRDMREDEPYLLARGPGEENALLYLALPPSLVDAARQLPALTPLTVTARVRTGRSAPVGVPLLDVLTLSRR